MTNTKSLWAETFGTFWLVFGGCGSAVLSAAFPQLGIGFAGVSLAFELPGQVAQARLQTVPGREVWLYRLPLAVPATAAQATGGSP